MSDFSPEQSPRENLASDDSYVEKALLSIEQDIVKLLVETDAVDFQFARRFAPNGLVRVQRGLFICEASSVGHPDYLSVTDIKMTSPLLGGEFYNVREERIPTDEGSGDPLTLGYSFRANRGKNFVDSHSFRVAPAEKAKFSLKGKAKPVLLNNFPYQNAVQTHVTDTDLIKKAEGKKSTTFSHKLEASMRQNSDMTEVEVDRLQETIDRLTREFVDLVY